MNKKENAQGNETGSVFNGMMNATFPLTFFFRFLRLAGILKEHIIGWLPDRRASGRDHGENAQRRFSLAAGGWATCLASAKWDPCRLVDANCSNS